MQTEQSAALMLTADVICLSKDGQMLLVKRKHEPFAGMWALPGGQWQPGESLEETAKRELMEEVWLDVALPALLQSHTYSAPGRDPRGHVVTTAFIAWLDQDASALVPTPGSDATDARWFPWQEVPKQLAFDHKTIIEDAQDVPHHTSTQRGSGITARHLGIVLDGLARQSPAYLAALAAYLARPEDPTGLRVYNLRTQAQSLAQSFGIIDRLLEVCEQARENQSL